MSKLYTIEDIATITMLSARTIRNYIKQGFLVGKKIEGIWKFNESDMNTFLQNDYVKQSLISKKNALIYDYIIDTSKENDSVCSIYDYPVKDKIEADLIYTRVSNRVNSGEYSPIKFSYTYSNNVVRIILIGKPKQVEEISKNEL